MQINRTLKTVANRQWGYFTAQQAADAGYSRNLLSYHARSGCWTKAGRALFRLPGYADCLEADFVRGSLLAAGQSRTRLVVVGRGSALFYYGLLPERPPLTELTVSSLRGEHAPEGCLLYEEELTPADYTEASGFYVTTPERTLRDVRATLQERNLWARTVCLAREKNLIDSLQVRRFLAGYAIWYSPTGKATEVFPPAGTPTAESARARSRRRRAEQVGGSSWRGVGRSFTPVEIIVVMAIIGMMMGVTLPALHLAAGTGQITVCQNNLRQVAQSNHTYAGDNRYFTPVDSGSAAGTWDHMWMSNLLPYLRSDFSYRGLEDLHKQLVDSVFACPERKYVPVNEGGSVYGQNSYSLNSLKQLVDHPKANSNSIRTISTGFRYFRPAAAPADDSFAVEADFRTNGNGRITPAKIVMAGDAVVTPASGWSEIAYSTVTANWRAGKNHQSACRHAGNVGCVVTMDGHGETLSPYSMTQYFTLSNK